MRNLAYVDDGVLSCDPRHLHIIWPLWISVLKKHGLQVEPKKCHVWVPQFRGIDPAIDVLRPVSTAGLPGLGTAAQAKRSIIISTSFNPIPMFELLADATARSKQADEDAELPIHMVETTCEQPLRCAAWRMLVRSLGSPT